MKESVLSFYVVDTHTTTCILLENITTCLFSRAHSAKLKVICRQ